METYTYTVISNHHEIITVLQVREDSDTVYAEIFAVFRRQYGSAKFKIAKNFPISVIFAAVTSSFPLLC